MARPVGGDRTAVGQDQGLGDIALEPEPVRLEFRRGVKGNGVTALSRLNMHPRLKDKLLSDLKKRFGCGGTVKDGTLELQGDRREPLEVWLLAEGYKVKRIGG